MARPHPRLETEIKLRIESPATTRRLLARLGYSIATPRVFESNTIFDTPDARLRRAQNLLRLRQAGARNTIAFKGPPIEGKYKVRPEVESDFTDSAAMREILGGLGLRPVFRYEKYRTEYRKPRQPGSVMLDETPIGEFVELEGPPNWIDRAAKELGYSAAEYITDSYGGLYLAHCKCKRLRPGHMLFSGRK